jgi:hypothetical protein
MRPPARPAPDGGGIKLQRPHRRLDAPRGLRLNQPNPLTTRETVEIDTPAASAT